MTQEKQLRGSELSKNADLERLMREFGSLEDCVADYPINNRETRRRIGELINGAVQSQLRPRTA